MHLAGFAVLVVFVAAQVPAVLYLGRYFEREADDAPARAFRREGGPRERGEEAPRNERSGAHGRGAGAEAGGVRATDGVEVIAAADAAEATRDRRRCPTCGADNHPEYAYCHGCLAELPPGEALD